MTDKWTVVPHRTPADVAEAELIQAGLRERLVFPDGPIEPPATVTGLDISYAVGSRRAVAAAVTVDVSSRHILEVATAQGAVRFPYVPGLLAFREVPLLLEALERLTGGRSCWSATATASPTRAGSAWPATSVC